MSAEVIDLAVVRAATALAVPVEEYLATAPMSLDEIDAEVAAIRGELVRPLIRLAVLRQRGAHLTAFGAGTPWHRAVEIWLGDLTALRLSGSPEAIAERNELVWSMREDGAPTRAIRERLGVSSYAVNEALRLRDPAPEEITSADGSRRSARVGRIEPEPMPVERYKWQTGDRLLRRAPDGLTIASLAKAAGWSEGSASGVLSDLRKRGRAVRTEERRDGMRVHRSVSSDE